MGIEGVPSEMLAIQVTEFNKPYKIGKIATPQSLKEHEILVKTAVASLCHTDGTHEVGDEKSITDLIYRHGAFVMEGKFPTRLPCVASHEGTGTVITIGSAVKNFNKGDRVMSGIPRNACTQCQNCKGPNDWKQYCENMEGHNGVIVDGCFAEYHVADSRTSAHMPDNLSLISGAPLACAGSTIYRGIIVSQVKQNGWLGIVGAGGGLGHLGIQMALAIGINVIAVDARDEALDLCRSTGAKHVFDAREGKNKVVKQIQDLTDGEGVEATLNLSEHETAAPLSCAITRMHGTVVQISQPDNVSVPFTELIFRDIKLIGSLIAGQEQSQEMLDLVADKKIEVETNIFHGLDEVPKMVELSHSGKMKGKAVVIVDQAQIDAEKGKVVA